ncbi:MAG: hypothetical protein ABI968_12980 [Acidobacteriota bacterium]
MDSVERHPAGLREATALLVGSRLALLVLALFALRYFPINAYNRDHNSAYAIPLAAGDRWREPAVAPDQAPPPVSAHAEPSWIAVWARWDALWYVRIAEVGYAERFGVDDLPGTHGEPPATGFYPLMSLLMRALAPLVGSPLRAGLVIANVALAFAVVLLFRLTHRLAGADAASIAVTLLLVFPPGFFLSAPYADSLGLALSLASLSAALRGSPAVAGIFGFLSALSRPMGVLLAPALAIQWWQSRRADPSRRSWLGAAASLLPVAGLAAFLLYCKVFFGDPWAPFHRQETWRGPMTWPPAIFHELAGGHFALLAPRHSVVELVAAVLFLVLGALAFRYLPLSVAAYGLGATLLPLATSLFSFSRLALAAFPAFMTAGVLLSRRPALARGLVAFFGVLLGVFALFYFSWNWIG